jgi:hypothetical protein
MAEAIFRHGDPVYADYTPTGGNVAAGQVVLLGNTTGLTCGVAHLDILNSTLGALAVGGGIYDVVMAGNYAAWTQVWWDDSANKVTTTSTNNALFGFLVEGGTGANTTVECLHKPYGF